MESIPKNELLEFRPDTMESIRKAYNFEKPGEIDEAIDRLDEWVKKQPHLKKTDYSREYLERSIILVKGSVERAKKHIDRLCTLKTVMPHFFDKYDAKNDFDHSIRLIAQCLMPKLTEDHYRIYNLKVLSNDLNSSSFMDGYKIGVMLCEYVQAHDYCNGFVSILDYRDIGMTNLIAALNIAALTDMVTILMDGFAMRIKEIHLITTSKMVETLVALFKKAFGPKMRDRIHVHTSAETLYKFVSKEYLPLELGGEERSIEKLYDQWLDVLASDDFVKYIKESYTNSTNEALRPKDQINELNLTGTFRTLNVD